MVARTNPSVVSDWFYLVQIVFEGVKTAVGLAGNGLIVRLNRNGCVSGRATNDYVNRLGDLLHFRAVFHAATVVRNQDKPFTIGIGFLGK